MRTIILLTFTVLAALPAHAADDKTAAIKSVIAFRKAFIEGRLDDTLAMAPRCVLEQMAAEKGMSVDGLLAARKDETSMIRGFAEGGEYVFNTNVSLSTVHKLKSGVKVFAFDAVAQLGALMPSQKLRMAAIYADGKWYVSSSQTKPEKKQLLACIPGLKQKDLK